MTGTAHNTIYFDNAATTAVDPLVRDAMVEAIDHVFGNPSSVHATGRAAKVLVEDARRDIAGLFNARTNDIYFTSGGTEALVTALRSAVLQPGYDRIITSKAEHPAVLETVASLEQSGDAKVGYVRLDREGRHDMAHLEEMLGDGGKAIVCLMFANNVIGTLLPVSEVGSLCRKSGALFICDTVQAIGKYPIDFAQAGIHFAASSAHKYHGPKGTGFLYADSKYSPVPLMTGGGQEKGMRSGTENTAGIAGMRKALEMAYQDLEPNRRHISDLKQYAVRLIRERIGEAEFIAGSDTGGLYNLFYVAFPRIGNAADLLFRLDMAGIALSTGSACGSGISRPSPVMLAIGSEYGSKTLRFSFSKYNTMQEVDTCIDALARLF